jgi:hypothetical protein
LRAPPGWSGACYGEGGKIRIKRLSPLAANPLSLNLAAQSAAGMRAAGVGIEALFAALLDTSAVAQPGDALKVEPTEGSAPKSDKPLVDARDGSSRAALIAAAPAIFPPPIPSIVRAITDTSTAEGTHATLQAPVKSAVTPAASIANMHSEIAAGARAAGTRAEPNPLPAPLSDRAAEAMDLAVSAGNFAWPEPLPDLPNDLSQLAFSMNPPAVSAPDSNIAATPFAPRPQAPSAHITRFKQPGEAANPAARAVKTDGSAVAPPGAPPADGMQSKNSAPSMRISHPEVEAKAASESRPSPMPDWFVKLSQGDVAPNIGSTRPRANPIPVRVVAPAATRTATSSPRPQDSLPQIPEPAPGALHKPVVLHLDRVFEPAPPPRPEETSNRNPQAASDGRSEIAVPREAAPQTRREDPGVKPASDVAVTSNTTAARRSMPLPSAMTDAEFVKFEPIDTASRSMPPPGAATETGPAKFVRADAASRSMPVPGVVIEADPAKFTRPNTASKSMPLRAAAAKIDSGKIARADVPAKESIGTPIHEPKDASRKIQDRPVNVKKDAGSPTSKLAPAPQPGRPIVKRDDPETGAATSDEPAQPIHAVSDQAAQPASAATGVDAMPNNAAATPAAAPAVVTKLDAPSTPLAPEASQAATTSSLQHADLGTLAVKIAAKSRDGDRHFDIRLDPPELGRIDVHLYVDQSGRAQAHLSADKPHTLALLQQESAELQRGLRDAGLELSNNGLNFSLKGQEHRDGAPQPAPRSRAFAEVPREAAAPALHQSSHAANGRLDIRI